VKYFDAFPQQVGFNVSRNSGFSSVLGTILTVVFSTISIIYASQRLEVLNKNAETTVIVNNVATPKESEMKFIVGQKTQDEQF
jgi:hypothetical protein